MLFAGIRQASQDGLTGRVALALAGIATASMSIWLALSAVGPLPYQLFFIGFACLGLYIVGLAVFCRAPKARSILLSYFFAPIGIVCIAFAMPIAAAIRRFRDLLRV